MDLWICKDRPSHSSQKSRIILNKMELKFQVQSMMNDGSSLRDYDSRGTNKYVEEVYEETGVLSYDEEMASGTGIEKPIATKHQEQSSPPSNPPSKTFMPIDQRKWKDLPAANDVMRGILAWRVSKIATQVSRRHGLHRECDGAIDLELSVTYVAPRFRKRRMPGVFGIHNGCI